MGKLFNKKSLWHSYQRIFKTQHGFTAIEVLVTISIVAILFSIATPSFSNLVYNNRLSSSLTSLTTMLKLARSKSMSLQTPVIVCATDNGETCSLKTSWSTGYMSFLDGDGLGKPSRSNAKQELILLTMEQPVGTYMNFFGPSNLIRFNSTGAAIQFNGTMSICDDRGEKFAKGLVVTPIGTIRAAKDIDTGEILNVNGSENVSC